MSWEDILKKVDVKYEPNNPNWNRKLIEEEIHDVTTEKPKKGNCPICHGFFDVDLPHPDACKCDECPKCGLDMASTDSNQCRCY